ncbi:MAG: hypothetical protein BWY85_01227 [Firmicutes bacterium ADurb.Bin506]|jgi:hypothetical protein|nr:MAG: hypothetical protein BWY85_01227 [Firmicutes bacterium ADurb.Bin506]
MASGGYRRDIVGPVLLILAGILLLMNTTGMLPWAIWGELVRFWPVLIILWGIGIIFGQSRAIGWALGSAALIGVVALVVWTIGSMGSGGFAEFGSEPKLRQSFSVSSSEYDPAAVRLTVDVAAADTYITAAPAATGQIVSAEAKYHTEASKPVLSKMMVGSTLELRYATSKTPHSFWPLVWNGKDVHRLELGRPDLPTALDLSVAAGRIEAELGRTAVTDVTITVGGGTALARFASPGDGAAPGYGRRLKFDVGAGTVDISGIGNTQITSVDGDVGSGTAKLDFGYEGSPTARRIEGRLEVGAGTLVVNVPRGIGLALVADVGAGSVYVNGSKQGGRSVGSSVTWESPDYYSAGSTLRLTVHVGAGKIEVNTGR